MRASSYVLGWSTFQGHERSQAFTIFRSLQEFNFTVEYRPGKDNPADYTSRHQVCTPENTTDYKEQKQTEKVVNSTVRRNVPESLLVKDVREATMNDPVQLEVMDTVQNGNGESRYKSENL